MFFLDRMERISSLHSYVIERQSLSAVDLVEDDETDGAFLRLDTFTLFSKRLSSFLRKGAPSRAIKTIDLPQSFLYQAHLKQHCLLWCPSHFCTHWRPRSLDSSSSITVSVKQAAVVQALLASCHCFSGFCTDPVTF